MPIPSINAEELGLKWRAPGTGMRSYGPSRQEIFGWGSNRFSALSCQPSVKDRIPEKKADLLLGGAETGLGLPFWPFLVQARRFWQLPPHKSRFTALADG
jgi:hypothetical protein